MPSGHHNPNFMAVKGYNKVADPVYVGQYQLSKGLVSRISSYKSYMPREVPKENTKVKVMGQYFYHSLDPLRPQVCHHLNFFVL